MKNNSKLTSQLQSIETAELVMTKEEKFLDQLQPVSKAVSDLVLEGGETFADYLKSIGLAREKRMMVLPSVHHYYYEKDEMAGIKTLVNLKSLNLIEHPERFLNTLINMLPPDTNFIGCFSENRKSKGRSGRLLNKLSILVEKFINILDSKIVHFMNRNDVFSLLEKHGFSIVDMTELNGVTYFYSQNAPSSAKLRAAARRAVTLN